MAKATNIVGENHKPYVSKQIQIRQEILGQSFRGSEELSWANSKTAWVRVVSSIDIADQQIPLFENAIAKGTVSNNGKEIKLKDLGLPDYPGGSSLAKDMTLFGGTSKTSINDNGDVTGYSSNSSLKYGLATSDSTLPGISTSYGMGGTEFGLNAMPGIISFTTENVNKGALRISNISLRANNKKQFEYLETLYMRLGYTVLVEWGNSSYYKQNSNGSQSYISGIASQRSLSADFIQATPKNKDAGDTLIDYFYKKIEEYREESQGNYDALVGKVRNFNWSFNPDGSYIINVELVSYGDVIESLSISELYSDTKTEIATSGSSTGIKVNGELIEVNSSLEAFIVIASTLPKSQTNPGNNAPLPKFSNKTYPSTKEPTDKTKEIVDKLNYDRSKTPSNGKIILGLARFGQSQELQRFIRLGDILDYINQKCLIYDAERKNLIKIDTNPNTNIGYSNKYQISADPKRVLVRNKFAFPLEFDPNFKVNIFAGQGKGLEEFHYPIDESKGQWYCKIMNLYFNTEFVLENLKGYLNKESNKIDLFSFLKSLLTSANQSLGSVNQFNIRLSEEHTLQIYDEVRPVGYESLLLNPEESYPLHVYGLSPSGSLGNSSNEGNFITSLNIKSELSKDFSTLVSIGAQSRGTAVGEDATFFSKWNVGLVDRIVPEKLDWNSLIHTANTQRAALSSIANNYIYFLKSYTQKLALPAQVITTAGTRNNIIIPATSVEGILFYDFSLETSPKFLKAQRDFMDYFLSIDAQQNGTLNPTVGFLPINVSLTMDGLSGVRIFDTLTIDTRFLPKSYQSSLDFIIKTVKHSVDQSNKWNTYIETFAVPKSKGQNQATLSNKKIQATISNIVQSPNNTPNYFTSNNPVISDYYLNIQRATLINPLGIVDIDAILYGLNSSPYVQNQFRTFLERIQNELGGGNGFEIQINSAYRPLGRNKQAGGVKNSAHITGLALDLQINTAATRSASTGNMIKGTTYVSNNVGDQAKWEATNIPSIAQELGITWGSIYQVNNKPDFVHFAIDGGESGAPTGQNATYNYVYIDNGNSYWGTGTKAGQLNVPTNNDRTNVTAYNNFASKWYNQLEQEFPTLSNIISTKYKSSVEPIWQADGLNVKDYIRVVESNGNIYFAVNPSFLKMNSAFLGQYPTQSTLKTTVKSGTIFNSANLNFFDVQQNLYAI